MHARFWLLRLTKRPHSEVSIFAHSVALILAPSDFDKLSIGSHILMLILLATAVTYMTFYIFVEETNSDLRINAPRMLAVIKNDDLGD